MAAVTQIRPFRNADLPALVGLWLEHWSMLGPPPLVDTARFEQAVLARTFFDPNHLLIAEVDGETVGWCHYAVVPDDDTAAVICAIAISLSAETSTESDLMSAVIDQARSSGVQRLSAGLIRDDQQGYAGLDPLGYGIGIHNTDMRTATILQQSGFKPTQTAVRLMASVDTYRPRVSRDAMQLRRSATSESTRVTFPDARRASAMSHLDVDQYRLTDRSGTELANLGVWLSDPEAEVMNPSMAILDLGEAQSRGTLSPAADYLISVTIQSLAERRIATVETAVDSDKSELISQLTATQFQNIGEGARWEKALDVG